MSDDLEQFHARNMASDPQYAGARQLLQLGEAVTQLREGAKMTRGQLGKPLHVKAQDIAIIEEETPRAPAGLLEAALRVLLKTNESQAARPSCEAGTSSTLMAGSRFTTGRLGRYRLCGNTSWAPTAAGQTGGRVAAAARLARLPVWSGRVAGYRRKRAEHYWLPRPGQTTRIMDLLRSSQQP